MPHGRWVEVMQLANWSCVRCGRLAESVDHKLPRSRGGTHDLFNLQAMCGDGVRGCHGWKEANPQAAVESGFGVAGSVTRGRYRGPDEDYRRFYNGEVAA